MSEAVNVRVGVLLTLFAACCVVSSSLCAKDIPALNSVSPLDHGFAGLYNLDFGSAQQDFAAWQKMHPDDPMGPVSEAAGILFSEFNRLGVLEAQFYENDDAFVDRPKRKADPALHEQFQKAIARTETLARARLS